MKKMMAWMLSIIVLLVGCTGEEEGRLDSTEQGRETQAEVEVDGRRFGNFYTSEKQPLVVYLPGTGAHMPDKETAAVFETSSGRVFSGDYLPSILMSAAYPSYYVPGEERYEVDEELLEAIFDMKQAYYEQEYNSVHNWRELDIRYYSGHPEAKGTRLFAEGMTAYDRVGIFMSGGRAGGIDFHNSLLMDAAFFHSKYEEDGEKMVFKGIPTMEDTGAYSANISAMAVGFSTTKQPEEVYKLARYLMDYDYTAFYGFSVNKALTEKQLADAAVTEIRLLPDTAWATNIMGAESLEEIEKQTTILKPLDAATVEEIRNMLNHMAGAGLPYAPIECWLYGKVQDGLMMGEKSPQEAVDWVAEELEWYQKGEREPFENMVEWEYAE